MFPDSDGPRNLLNAVRVAGTPEAAGMGVLVCLNGEIQAARDATKTHSMRGGVPEAQRKAWLFTNVTDSRGRHYDIPVVVGAMAANREIYACGLHVTAITRRRDAVLVSIISQVTPSESSLIKRVSYEPMALNFVRGTLGLKNVLRVALHEPLTNLRKVIVVQMRDPSEVEVWQALTGLCGFQQSWGKLIIAVDEDIDPDSTDAVLWAMAYRMKPHRDVQIVRGKHEGHGSRTHRTDWGRDLDSAMLVNATRREQYPPVSLPKREFMERARTIWDELRPELGLPELQPQSPWYGYSLGLWSEALEEEARLATEGLYYRNGDGNYARRIKSDNVNGPAED